MGRTIRRKKWTNVACGAWGRRRDGTKEQYERGMWTEQQYERGMWTEDGSHAVASNMALGISAWTPQLPSTCVEIEPR